MEEVDWWDLGTLVSATAGNDDVGLWCTLVLGFSDGGVRFDAIGADDTITVRPVGGDHLSPGEAPETMVDVTRSSPWSNMLGDKVVWARSMTNHQGYEDGFQLEFSRGQSPVGDCVELVVVASELHLGTASFDPSRESDSRP